MSKDTVQTLGFRGQVGTAIFVLRLLWRHSKGMFVAYMLSSLSRSITPLLNAVLVGKSVGEIAKTINGTGSLQTLVVLLVEISAVNMFVYVGQSFIDYFSRSRRDYLEMDLQQKMLVAKSQMPLDVLELPDTVVAIERASEGLSHISWYTSDIIEFVTRVVGVIGAGAVLFYTAPWLLIALIPMPVFGLWARTRQYRKFRDIWDRSRASRIRANSVEALFGKTTSVLEVRLFGLTKKLLDLWHEQQSKTIGVRKKDERSFAVITGFTYLFETIIGVGADVWLAIGLFDGRFSVAIFEQTRQLVGSFIGNFAALSSSLSDMPQSAYKVLDYQKFVEQDHAQIDAHTEPILLSSLVLEHVEFSYPSADEPSLIDVSLQINTGDHIAIVGQNGAGKTTLLRLLLGMYTPSRGRVVANDCTDISGKSGYLNGKVAAVMQDFSDFDFMTIGQSVGLIDFPKYDKKRARQALETVGLYDHFVAGKGLESNFGYVEDDGIKLSGGQNQRLALARALYADTDMLVMDEPTSMIDAKDEQDIIDAVFGLYRGKTALLVSHRLSTVKRADKIVVMKAGRVVETGTHKQLFVQGTAYHDLFHKQARAYSED
jgi:ATP-binding cassette, subfamily B, bacterial